MSKSMKSVWAVERGSYSDYHVVGVFSTEARAKQVADAVNCYGWEDATVTEWPLDPYVEQLHTGRLPYVVTMDMDGTAREVKRSGVISSEPVALCVRQYLSEEGPQVFGTVWATDEKHAVKIANEFRIRHLAENP